LEFLKQVVAGSKIGYGDEGAFGEVAPITSAPVAPAHVRPVMQSRVTVATTETGKKLVKSRCQASLNETTAK
jgi:hypothetical protein